MLSCAIAAQLLESIAGGQPKVLELDRRVDEPELAEHRAPDVGREASDRLALPEPFGVAVSEAPNHGGIITWRVIIRKRGSLPVVGVLGDWRGDGPAHILSSVTNERFRPACITLSLLAALAAPDARAQQVTGRLSDARGAPSVGTLVVATRARPDSLSRRTVTGPNGAFTLAVPVGQYRIEALRIGHRPVLLGEVTLGEGEQRRLDATLPDRPITLAAVTTRDRARCDRLTDGGEAVVTLFEEVKKALMMSQVGSVIGRPVARIVVANQLTDPRGVPLGPPTLERRAGESNRPFQSAPPALLASVGYVTTDESGSTYRAPDATVILSPWFAASNCLRVVEGSGDRAHLVGLAFRPATLARGIVGVEGTLWVERTSMQLERIEFSYVGLPSPLRRANLGGAVAFTRAPDGTWFEDRWEIRMPRTTIHARPSIGPAGAGDAARVEVLDAIQVVRGEVLALESAGRSIYVGNTALEDSLRAAEGDGADTAAVADLTEAPVCTALRPDGEPAATVFGTVFERPPERSPGALVTARWREDFRVVGRAEVQWVDREQSSTTADDGFYSLCALPRTRLIRLQATKGGRETPAIGARVPWAADRVRANLQFVESAPASAPRRTVPIRVVGPGGAPVPFAVVDAGPGTTRVADSSGVAHLPQVATDAQRVRVRRIGFASLDTVVALRAPGEVRVELRPLGQLLESVVVTATAGSPLVRTGFYDRVQRVQRGAITAEFVTPEEIDARDATQLSELLRGRRTITVTRALQPSRTVVKGRGGCDMTILLDGQRVRSDVAGAGEGPVAIDDRVGGRSVMAVEIYPSTANAPAELIPLTGGGSCGIIAIWTGAP